MGWNEDLERLALQERELVLPKLDMNIAWELGSRLEPWLRSADLAW